MKVERISPIVETYLNLRKNPGQEYECSEKGGGQEAGREGIEGKGGIIDIII